MATSPPATAATPDGKSPGLSTGAGAAVTETIERMVAGWRRGERLPAEEFIARHPEFCDEDVVRIIYEEACLRQDLGENSVSEEIYRRFPQWRSKLALLLDCQKWLWESSPTAPDFPEAGQVLGDFRLLAEIGRGAHGRTFLASQGSLGQRPLILKITPLGHDEHLSLARLQHMHIVPLYFEQVMPDRHLRVLGMPYLGGTTLDRILEALRAVPLAERNGRQIIEILDRCEAARGTPLEDPTKGPFRNYLAQAPYVQAICWIGACLADALQYAHDRGLVHMDIKPSNVLIAGDGQPMLLDFHLAHGAIGPGFDLPDRLGGTPDYLSPEQRDAMDAVRQGTAIPDVVDGRSDIYSLGLLLDAALGGEEGTGNAAATTSVPARRALEHRNPRVSPGLSDIVQKCLAHDPGDRYRTAAALAQDLRRHLNDQILRGVPNRSPAERWRKWRRRSPAALARALLWVAGIASMSLIVWVVGTQSKQQTQGIELALAEGRERLKNHHHSDAVRAFNHGLELASPLPDNNWRKRVLKAELQQALREQAITELHDLVDLLRFRYGISPPADKEARSLFLRGQEIWRRRRLLWQPEPGQPRTDAEEKIRIDLLDLATILADLCVHRGSAGGGNNGAVGVAVQILRDAVRQFGGSPAISRDLRAFDQSLGRTEGTGTAIPTPHTAWEHYDLGRSYLRSGDYTRAEAEFHQSVERQPGEFWPHFFRGVCAYRLGRYPNALAALDICVALAPRTAECYYNRAKVDEALDQAEQAMSDYSRALELNPSFSDAALNRGILAFRAGRAEEAIADLERARSTARGPSSAGWIAYNLALVHIKRKDWPAARASLEQAIASGNTAARQLIAELGLD